MGKMPYQAKPAAAKVLAHTPDNVSSTWIHSQLGQIQAQDRHKRHGIWYIGRVICRQRVYFIRYQVQIVLLAEHGDSLQCLFGVALTQWIVRVTQNYTFDLVLCVCEGSSQIINNLFIEDIAFRGIHWHNFHFGTHVKLEMEPAYYKLAKSSIAHGCLGLTPEWCQHQHAISRIAYVEQK